MDNLTAGAARIFEAFRDATGAARPPSPSETLKCRRAIQANGGEWEPIAEHVRTVTVKALAAGTAVRSVAYGLTAWHDHQRRLNDSSLPADARGRGLVRRVADAVGVRRTQHDQPAPPRIAVTSAEREGLDRLRKQWEEENG